MPGNCRRTTGVQFRFPSVSLALPSVLDLGIRIKADNESLEKVRTIGRGKLQDFGFKGFQVCTHADLRSGLRQRSLPQRLVPLSATGSGFTSWILWPSDRMSPPKAVREMARTEKKVKNSSPARACCLG